MDKKLNDIQWSRDPSGYIQPNSQNIDAIKDLLNSTGPGFCLAKFNQVTLHLGTGLTHACHHPSPHHIPLDELNQNPNALFNTSHLKSARREMLSGTRPKECDYCWRVEDNHNGNSDRFYKSLEPWALESHDKIKEQGADADYYPTYLEVDFSNVCNFSCTYCGPEFSSVWAENLKKNGPIKVLENTPHVQWVQGWQKDLNTLAYKNREFNPYLDAFWKWFPEAYKHLKVYRITGGEPLLSKETFKSMDWFLDNPNTELEFSINSNLGAPDKVWDQFIEKIEKLVEAKAVKRFTIFTSVDAWGSKAEYIRPGLNFELFKKRYEQLLQMNDVRAVIMCTFNIFSITSIQQLFEWHVSLRKKYNKNSTFSKFEEDTGFVFTTDGFPMQDRIRKNPSHFATVGLDIPYLRSPSCLDAQFADRELVQNYLIPAINYMAENTSHISWNAHQGFEEYELEKFKRVVSKILYFVAHSEKHENHEVLVNRAKFYDFVNDIDKRFEKNFLECFPEMEEFYKLCQKTNIEIRKGSSTDS